MPLYEYECTKCHRRTEKIENLKGPFLKKCPHCGGKLERLLSSPAIQFKGSGWYVTDYAGKKGAPASEGSGAKSESKESAGKETGKDSGKDGGKETSGEKSSSKESSGGSETKEKKPAKKKE